MNRTGRSYALYRYAYTAHCGRVAQPVRFTLIGETEAIRPAYAIPKIRQQVRMSCGLYPRTIKLSKGQFVKMT